MGRSVTPKYAMTVDGNPETCFTWDCKRYGRPTVANIEKWVMAFAKSLEVGGSNAHLSESLGYIPYPRTVVVKYNERNGVVVASWKAAMFQVYA
jgi:hypothetical protein